MAQILWQYTNPGRLTSIEEALACQEELFQKKLAGDAKNYILFAEHEPVYTYPPRIARELDAYCRIRRDALPARLYEMPEQRGGSITYHGPGQLVCYVICDLPVATFGVLGLNKFLGILDTILRDALELFGIPTHKKPNGLPPAVEGVWVIDNGVPKKIASHGMCARRMKVSQQAPITKYGWALNVHTDLSYFDHIYPCGCDIPMTSMKEQAGCGHSALEVAEVVAPLMAQRLAKVLSQ